MKPDFPLQAVEKLRRAAFSLNCVFVCSFFYFFHSQFMLQTILADCGKHRPLEAGKTASESFPETSAEIASFCSDFNAWDLLNSETLRCFLESGVETNNFTMRARHLSLSPTGTKCRNGAQMTHLACDWQLKLNCTNQKLRLWVNGVLQNNDDFMKA